MNLIRTTPAHGGYQSLVTALDRDLAVTDQDDHAFYSQFNKSDKIPYVVVVEENGQAIACGALKPFDDRSLEVKRMYTAPGARGRGIAVSVLRALEAWARELGYHRLVLETGKRQTAALRLYDKYGFDRMPINYGPYRDMENSVCMEKIVDPGPV
ncbi:GNAT family N-acetyltransferase [Lewinella sp. JB7]|uniref:GNAT family N-acetyltransferase n=1 Tax=Lewinella sp. JB7 TaxID=2962887 RepID=UPI0020C96FBE|nr:GNAT family N-acetyltransferase [Lewinella sp. JB7]MCP9237413.1 GNAT family N-acetyltransferase [Lewinella sp. JB7]